MLDLELSNSQKKWIGYALTCISVCIVLSFTVFSIKILGSFLNDYILVFAPLTIAAILSVLIKPIIDKMSSILRIPRAFACALTFILLIIALCLIAILLLPKAITQIVAICDTIPEATRNILLYLQKYPFLSEKINAILESLKSSQGADFFTQNISNILKQSLKSIQTLGSFVISISCAIAAFAVVPIYLFFMLVSDKSVSFIELLENKLSFLKPDVKADIIYLCQKFWEVIIIFFRGQIIIAFLTGLILGTGLELAGVKFGFIIGFTTGCINIIPYLGSIIGLSVMLPVSYFQDGGGFALLAITIAIFTLAELINAYAITPYIMSGRTKLSPMMIIFSVFFWGTALSGIMGMLLAIPLTAFIKAFWDLFCDKYLAPLFISKKAESEQNEQIS